MMLRYHEFNNRANLLNLNPASNCYRPLVAPKSGKKVVFVYVFILKHCLYGIISWDCVFWIICPYTTEIHVSHLYEMKHLFVHNWNLCVAFVRTEALVGTQPKFMRRICTNWSICSYTTEIHASHLHELKYLFVYNWSSCVIWVQVFRVFLYLFSCVNRNLERTTTVLRFPLSSSTGFLS
jgi:hypothetical protein